MPDRPPHFTLVHGYCPKCRKVTMWEITGSSARYRTTFTCEGCLHQEYYYYWERVSTVRQGELESLPMFQSAGSRGMYALPRS